MDIHINKLVWNSCHRAAYFNVAAIEVGIPGQQRLPYEQPIPELS